MNSQKAVRRIAIVGTGTIGASWATHYLARGFDVTATDPAPGAEAALRSYVEGAWEGVKALGLAPGAALHITLEVLAGLAYAHNRRSTEGASLAIIHRDVSPSNILCSAQGEVKLSDFGIAKAATHSSLFYRVRGKVGYMSPEQARNEPIDHRTDLYSVAVCLYEALTAERLGVSRVPVREALAELLKEGLVVPIGARGTCVRAFTLQDLGEIVELRQTLEVMAVRLLCRTLSDEDAAELLAEARRGEAETSPEGVGAADVRFHQRLLRATRHSRLIESWNNLRSQIEFVSVRVHRGVFLATHPPQPKPSTMALVTELLKEQGKEVR